jgi:mono/diheme cytochrome c family protein
MFKNIVNGVQVAVLLLVAFAVVELFINDAEGAPSVDYATGFPDAQVAADLFATNCAGCHGADGSGVSGPSLQGIEDRLSVEEETAVITNGRGGGMPAWQGRLTDTQIQLLVRFTREVL